MLWKWPKCEYFIISLCCVYIYHVRMRVLMSTFNVITERIISVVAFCFLWMCKFHFSSLAVCSLVFDFNLIFLLAAKVCGNQFFGHVFFFHSPCYILFYYFQCYISALSCDYLEMMANRGEHTGIYDHCHNLVVHSFSISLKFYGFRSYNRPYNLVSQPIPTRYIVRKISLKNTPNPVASRAITLHLRWKIWVSD